MAPILMRLRWYARRGLAGLGWQGVVGCLAIVLALLGRALWLPAQRAEIDEFNRQIQAAAQTQQRLATPQPTQPVPLTTFYRFFPPVDTIPDWIDKLSELAGKHKLALAKAQYQLEPMPPLRLRQYRITLPLTGRYLDIRQFLQDLLQTMPHAVLDDASFERKDLSQGNVTANIQFRMVFGEPL